MNLTQLADAVVKDTGMSKKDSEKAIKSTFENIQKAMSNGDKFSLIGFSSFEVKRREARSGRNPKSGDVIQIPACNAPVFKPGKQLKEAINQ